MESNCGIYLKWFNGGYSYWLFDKFYSDKQLQKTIDEIVGKYDNLKNVNSFSTITGKEANATYKIQTRFNVLYKEYITSILTSPSVEMYVHQTPFNQIDVNYCS
jgi:serine/threonine-protein kinase RIO1